MPLIDLYPPNPLNVPADLTKPSAGFRKRMVLMLFGIILFLVVYFALVAGSAYLFGQALMLPVDDRGSFWIMMISVVITGLLFVFSIKFIFKWGRVENPSLIELKEKDHPELFAFIRQLVADTGTRFPKKVFASPDINAAVFYHSSFLSLFFPVRKNLLIGLSLVNCLDLSEFKSVLAHEFGHFSQRSMKFGSYVYTAQRIIIDMVYQRDAFDEMIGNAGRVDFRLAVVAWFFFGILWLVRKLLEGVLKVILYLNGALSREMEFHADLVSVSVAGSLGIVRSLYDLDLGMRAFQSTLVALHNAKDAGIYTSDFFRHHQKILESVREATPLPQGDRLFQPGDKHEIPDMYASHPDDYQREENARRRFVEAPHDDRSPWLLMGSTESLKKELTLRIYRDFLGLESKVKPEEITQADPEKMEEFIASEIEEQDRLGIFEGVYEMTVVRHLDLKPGSLPSHPPSLEEFEALVGEELKEKLDRRKQYAAELDTLAKVLVGEKRLKKLVFRGKEYQPAKAKDLAEMVQNESGEDADWFNAFHQEVYNFHLRLAGKLGGELSREFHIRWEFNQKLWATIDRLDQIGESASAYLNKLSKREEFTEKEVVSISKELKKYRDDFAAAIKEAKVPIPKLKHVEETTLRMALFGLKEVPDPPEKFNDVFIAAFFRWLNEAHDRAVRLYHKNLSAVILAQEKMRKLMEE